MRSGPIRNGNLNMPTPCFLQKPGRSRIRLIFLFGLSLDAIGNGPANPGTSPPGPSPCASEETIVRTDGVTRIDEHPFTTRWHTADSPFDKHKARLDNPGLVNTGQPHPGHLRIAVTVAREAIPQGIPGEFAGRPGELPPTDPGNPVFRHALPGCRPGHQDDQIRIPGCVLPCRCIHVRHAPQC